MKTEKTNSSSRSGGILVMVMVIIVTLSLLVLSLLNLGKFSAFETERQLEWTQSRWIAEAGFEKAAANIKATGHSSDLSEDFENDPSIGHYDVTITEEIVDSEVTKLTIVSVGTVNSADGEPVQTQVRADVMKVAKGVDQALLGLNGTSTINANVLIDSIVYVNGNLVIRNPNNTEITEMIELGGLDTSIQPPSFSPQTVVEDIDFPHLDRTPYENLLQTASTNAAGNQTLKNTALNGGTRFVNGNVTIDGSITGGGTIVATGTVRVDGHSTIGSGIKVVAGGDVTFRNHPVLEEQTEIFTMTDIIFDTQAATAAGTTLLAMGDITTKNIDFIGIIYVEGHVYVTSGSDVRGTVIAWDGFDLAANVTVRYDQSVFANPNPLPFLTWVETERGRWEERPY